MYITHSTMNRILEEYEPHIEVNAYEYCMTFYYHLKHAVKPYTTHILYIAETARELETLEPVEDMNLLVCNPERVDVSEIVAKYNVPINYTEIKCEFSDEIQMKLRDFYDEICGAGLVSETILNSLYNKASVQTLVDSFTHAFNNPIFVYDSGFNLIACNYDMAAKSDMGKRIIENMGFTEQEYPLLNSKNHIHKKVMQSETPIRVVHDEIGYEQMVLAVDTRKDMGHICVDASNRPFRKMDEKLLVTLKEGIYLHLLQEEFIKDNRGYPYEYFMKDLLDEKIATPKQYMEKFKYVNTEFSENMYCLVIETARSSDTLNVYLIRNKFESLFSNTKTLMYNGEIIVLFCFAKSFYPSAKDVNKIAGMCKKYGLYAGFSNNFDSLVKLHDFYKQALRAIEIGTSCEPEKHLFIYKDYYMEHMKNLFVQKESPEIYCHPKLKVLIDYDRKNNTQFAYSLYMYLLHERSSSAAADAMKIHRNTLVYRINKIETIVDINYEDAAERQYILMSCELLKDEINK